MSTEDKAFEQDDQPNYMNMSDEDMMNMSFPSESEGTEEALADEGSHEDEAEYGQEDQPIDESELDEELENDEQEDEAPQESDESEDDADEEATEELDKSSDEIDYKAKYEELMAPFRANGKDIKVETPEDLLRLAKMGVGFNARMTALKPIRKVAKMLENAGLMDEEKISYLIDLSNHNPDAINKLIKQSGINPLDIDTESTDGYKPNTYTVDDRQLDFDEALIDLKQSPTLQATLDVVSNKWDEASRRKLYDTPREIQKLDSQIQAGIFDKIMERVENEKILGRIPSSVSDIEAYNFIGNKMNEEGAFNTPASSTSPKTPVKPKVNAQLNSRKRAAATTRSKPTKQQSIPANVLSLDDAEFEKLMPNYI
jgi:hypothetical protein